MAGFGLALVLFFAKRWGWYQIPNPPMLFAIVIVFASYMGGTFSGITSAVIAITFTASDWTSPSHPWPFPPENLQRLLVAIVCLLSMAILVGMLKARTDFQYQIISQYATSLKESEEKFAKAFKHNPVISTIANLDDGIFLDVNDAFCRTLGWSWEEAVGRTGAELGLWTKGGQRERIVAEVKRYGRVHQVETECLSKTREIHTLLWNCDVIHTQNQPALLVSAEDITERKQAEIALRTSEEKFSKAFNAAPLLVSLTDLTNGRLIEVNDKYCEVLGYTRGELLGNTTLNLGILAPEDRKKLVDAVEMASGTPRNVEFSLRTKTGQTIPILFSGSVTEVGDLKILISMVLDVTELKQAETEKLKLHIQLLQAQKMESLGTLVAGVAHNLNNILAITMGAVSMREDIVTDPMDQEIYQIT